MVPHSTARVEHPQMTDRSPNVATNSLKTSDHPCRECVEKEYQRSPNIKCARIASVIPQRIAHRCMKLRQAKLYRAQLRRRELQQDSSVRQRLARMSE